MGTDRERTEAAVVHTEFGEAELRRLGVRLRELREARKLSLRSLSKESGVSVAAIRDVEAGKSSPSLLIVLSLAEALDEPVDRLIAASVESRQPPEILRGAIPRRAARYIGQMGLLAQPKMRGSIHVIPPKFELPEADRPAGVPIFIYVIEGKIELSLGEGRIERLSTGDAIHVARKPWTGCVNPSAKRATFLCVVGNADIGAL